MAEGKLKQAAIVRNVLSIIRNAQKLRNPTFKGKYFVTLIGKFQFDVPRGNAGLPFP